MPKTGPEIPGVLSIDYDKHVSIKHTYRYMQMIVVYGKVWWILFKWLRNVSVKRAPRRESFPSGEHSGKGQWKRGLSLAGGSRGPHLQQRKTHRRKERRSGKMHVSPRDMLTKELSWRWGMMENGDGVKETISYFPASTNPIVLSDRTLIFC